jgi:hypothetical protein
MLSLFKTPLPCVLFATAIASFCIRTSCFANEAAAPAPTATIKPAFPRLASHDIGDKAYDSPEYQALLARFDYVLLGFYKSWHGGPSAMRAAVRAIKARNPAILVGNYTILESSYWNADRSKAVLDAIQKLGGETGPMDRGGTWTPNDWWARDLAGKQVLSPGYPTAATTNITNFVTPDQYGDRYPQWFARWCNTEFFAPVPEIDIWYSDNAFYQPRVSADWDRDGKLDVKTDPVVRTYYRQGMAGYWATINRLRPGMVIMGNVDGRFDLAGVHDGFLSEPEYDGKIGGALLESALGRTFSAERQWGWDKFMECYRSLIDHTAAPHLVVVDTKLTPDGLLYEPAAERAAYGGGAHFAALRYVFASTLLEGGYFAVKNGGYNQKAGVWFDEFDLAGTATTSWLGLPIDPPQRKPFQDGVYLRRFEHGVAIVNPRSNPGTKANNRAAVDVAIPTSLGRFKRFAGKQDPATNNGEALPLNTASVPHLVIKAGDGVILINQ